MVCILHHRLNFFRKSKNIRKIPFMINLPYTFNITFFIGSGYLEGLLGDTQQAGHAQKTDKEEK